jgi:hypothetical protein
VLIASMPRPLARGTGAGCAAGLALLLLAACGPVPEMVLPDALAGTADSYEVSGANGSFLPFLFTQHVSFGPYSASAGAGIVSSEQEGATLFNGDKEHTSESQSGWFKLAGPASAWSGRCRRDSHAEIVHAPSIEADGHGIHVRNPAVSATTSDALRCDLRERSGRQWRLELDLDWSGPDAGRALSGAEQLVFGPSYGQKHQPFGGAQAFAGYVIQDQTGPVGALDTGGNPHVWMSRHAGPERRQVLAAICVALIVQRRFMD